MDVLATCRASSVLLVVALAASLSACEGPAFSAAPTAARTPVTPDAPDGASDAPSASPRAIDTDIAPFVPDDATVRLEKRGDLDGDGDQDVLLVLQNDAQAESAPRSLVILRGTADGSFEKSVENPNAILCLSCGGMMGDPLSDVAIQGSGFALVFEGGSRELWSRTYSFAYSEAEDDWYLGLVETGALDRIEGSQEKNRVTREQVGVVSIKDFDAALMAQDPDM